MEGCTLPTVRQLLYAPRNEVFFFCNTRQGKKCLITKIESLPTPRHYSNARQVNSSMEGVVKGMGSALKTMDVERISKTMDNFEQQFEDMDVRAGYMENAMSNSTSMSTPQEQVDGLIQMVADEAGLELGEQLDDAGPVSSKVPAKPEAAPAAADGEDELANRLAALRK